jgi:hypothetical protein
MSPRANSSWQEEAARYLLRSGFRPTNVIGQVEHIANIDKTARTGLTFGSVWGAMHRLIESEPECAGGKAQDYRAASTRQEMERLEG